jgi:hypothetical protein
MLDPSHCSSRAPLRGLERPRTAGISSNSLLQ